MLRHYLPIFTVLAVRTDGTDTPVSESAAAPARVTAEEPDCARSPGLLTAARSQTAKPQVPPESVLDDK